MTACIITPLQASGGGQVVEELEIDWAIKRPENLARLLDECGLDRHETQKAIAAGQDWADAPTPAILRVVKGPSFTSWEIIPDGAAAASPPLDEPPPPRQVVEHDRVAPV